MRKIYLIITTALLLLGSSTLWAATVATVDGEPFDNIGTAISTWSGQGKTTLTLLDNCVYDAGNSYCDLYGTKTLDLNDKTLTWISTNSVCIYSNNDGVLNIVGNSGSYNGKLIFNTDKYGLCTYDGNATINISNCIVSGTGVAVALMYAGVVNVKGESIVMSGRDTESYVVAMLGSDDPEDANYSVLNVEQKSKLINTTNTSGSYGIVVFNTVGKHAYGVVVNVDGKVYARNGMTILGNVQDIPGLNNVSSDANITQFNIGSNAEIMTTIDGGNTLFEESLGLYCAGYANWNIKGRIIAGSPIHAKAGTLNIDGAVIEAMRSSYTPFQYNGSGGNPTGNAIAIESNGGYAGKVQLNILNGAQIMSKAGYAVEEGVVCKSTGSCDEVTQQIGLTVVDGESANAFAGAKGTMSFSDSFAQALRDGSLEKGEGVQWVQNAITGGKYSAMPEVVADGYMVKITSDVIFPYEVVVNEESTGITDITSISSDTETEDDYTIEKGKAVVVKTGNTLNVKGKLIIGQNNSWPAQITVEPGATLIVKDGIEISASNPESAIVLMADKENGTGSLLFSGATENTNPIATVEMYVHAYRYDGDESKVNDVNNYKWQHFGLPVEGANVSIVKNMNVWYYDWVVNKGWVGSNSSNIMATGAWAGHNTTANVLAEGSKFKFIGNIVGNVDAVLPMEKAGYYCFANSYTSRISIKNLVTSIQGNSQTDGSLWIYDASKSPAQFDVYYIAEVEDEGFVDSGIAPMQAFYVKNDVGSLTNLTVNYVNDVYKFIPNSGETRVADASTNGGKITISDSKESATLTIRESEAYSDEIEKGYDIPQMETGMIQIYALQGDNKLSAIATNSIDGKEIEIVTKDETEYTLTFSNLKGNAFKLTDLSSGAEVEVGSDKTYTFTADANSTIKRFRLGEGEVAAEEYEANANVKIWANNGTLYVSNNDAEADIEIINLSGAKVASAKANGEALQQISISDLANGVYVVRVGAAAAKIIK